MYTMEGSPFYVFVSFVSYNLEKYVHGSTAI